MKKILTKKVIIPLLVIMLVFSGVAAAFEITPMAFQYLITGISNLAKNGNELFVFGDTHAGQAVDFISVSSYLQMWQNGSWVTVWSQTKIGYNKSYVSLSAVMTAPRGYTYRVYSVHNATHNGVSETATTSTGMVYH